MDDEFKIVGVEKVTSDVAHEDPSGERKKRQKKHRDEASRHLQELTKMAEKAHDLLIPKKSPYRFCIYEKGKDIFIDVVIVDTHGKIKETYKQNITHDEFILWIRHIEEESGLIIDEEI